MKEKPEYSDCSICQKTKHRSEYPDKKTSYCKECKKAENKSPYVGKMKYVSHESSLRVTPGICMIQACHKRTKPDNLLCQYHDYYYTKTKSSRGKCMEPGCEIKLQSMLSQTSRYCRMHRGKPKGTENKTKAVMGLRS